MVGRWGRGWCSQKGSRAYLLSVRVICTIKIFINKDPIRLQSSKTSDLHWCYSRHNQKLKLLFMSFLSPPPLHLPNKGMLNVSFFPFVNFSCCKQNSAMVIKISPASIKGRLPLKSLVLCLLYHRWTTSHCWNRLYRSKVCNRPKEKCDQSVYFPPCNDRPITKHELRCLYKYNCGLQCCCKISDKEHQLHRDGCP